MISVVIPLRVDRRRARIWDWVNARWGYVTAELQRLEAVQVVFADNGQPDFDRGGSRNAGVAEATGDILVIADADVIPELHQIADAIHAIRDDGHPWVFPYTTYINLAQWWTTELLNTRLPDEQIPVVDHDPASGFFDHLIRDSPAGMLVMPREAFHAAGGYDPRFQGWGYEDNAFMLAVDTLWGPHHRIPGDLLHLWHPVGANEAFEQPHIHDNRRLFRRYEKAAGNPTRMGELVGVPDRR